ncbi:unnamed protein product [Adineta steineri]|uniref:Uncharacterized protein n=1 Tax=Adineta steineri TaxID=433720 RepID=A0A814FFP0_9BILA|nr:unnamed protein product [Adineta steineri]
MLYIIIRYATLSVINSTTTATCNFTACNSQRISCSSNLNCDCFSLTSNSNIGICALSTLSCESFVRCNMDNVTCSIESTICVNSTRCGQPICYPLPMANKQICPPKTVTITTTTQKTTTTIKTSTATTTQKLTTTTKISTTTPTSTVHPDITTSQSGTTPMPKYTALLLSDSEAAVQNLINFLQSAGISCTYSSNNVQYYDGTPDAATFGVVIIVNSNSYGYNMPASGQQSILNAQQNNATGVVLTEWAAYQFSIGLWTTLLPLQLFTRSAGTTTNITMNLTIPNHPIWTNLSASFTSTSIVGCNTGGSLINNGTVLATCLQCDGGPGVAVRPSSILATVGRVVQIAHAGHYTVGGANFNWANDINLSTMMINAVKWAANLI